MHRNVKEQLAKDAVDLSPQGRPTRYKSQWRNTTKGQSKVFTTVRQGYHHE